MALNVNSVDSIAATKALVAKAGVVVQNLAPAAIERLGPGRV